VHRVYVIRMFRKGGVYGYSATKTALAHFRRKMKSRSDPQRKNETE